MMHLVGCIKLFMNTRLTDDLQLGLCLIKFADAYTPKGNLIICIARYVLGINSAFFEMIVTKTIDWIINESTCFVDFEIFECNCNVWCYLITNHLRSIGILPDLNIEVEKYIELVSSI